MLVKHRKYRKGASGPRKTTPMASIEVLMDEDVKRSITPSKLLPSPLLILLDISLLHIVLQYHQSILIL